MISIVPFVSVGAAELTKFKTLPLSTDITEEIFVSAPRDRDWETILETMECIK